MVTIPVHRAENPLARLHRLEWRFDGPVPPEFLATLDATPAELVRRAAAADGALIDRLARETVRAAATARGGRAAHTAPESHPEALHLARCRAAGLALRAGRR